MKKVIFSAIAMIAFVGSSRANNIAIDNFCEENLSSVLGEKSDSKILAENCNLVQYRAYNLARDLGYSADQARDYSYIYYFRCVYNNVRQIQSVSPN
jgi:hypothetical protein